MAVANLPLGPERPIPTGSARSFWSPVLGVPHLLRTRTVAWTTSPHAQGRAGTGGAVSAAHQKSGAAICTALYIGFGARAGCRSSVRQAHLPSLEVISNECE